MIKTIHLTYLAGILLFTLQTPSYSNIFEDYSQAAVRKVDWKLFFQQLFVHEIKRESPLQNTLPPFADTQHRIREHVAWTPLTFNEVIDEVLSAATSTEAYHIRQQIYDDPINYKALNKLNFSDAIPWRIRSNPKIKDFLKRIQNSKPQTLSTHDNFFATAAGANMMSAISWRGDNTPRQKIALVFVPGYAGHLIKFPIFEEILKNINDYYGRSESRPITYEKALTIEVESYQSYYQSNNKQTSTHWFDIITPAGMPELGNTAGYNLQSTQILAHWLETLPAAYNDHHFILMGYSKGAPVMLDILRERPVLKNRIIGMISYGGVIQGTNIARTALKALDSLSGDDTFSDLMQQLKNKKLEPIIRTLSPLINHIPFIPELSKYHEIMQLFGYDSTWFDDIINAVFERRELYELRQGIADLSPLSRTHWNLTYLNNDYFQEDLFIFNLSAITDISNFAHPGGITPEGQRQASMIAPNLTDTGELDWQKFSLDALFLYLSSIEGFKLAPGGLYDTQVELGNTKTHLLDYRPLNESLFSEEIAILWNDNTIQNKLRENNINALQQFSETPRNELMNAESSSHIHAVDLGEIKGHHWSIMKQAFRAPATVSSHHAVWNFPRQAYMRALLQTLSLYQLVKQLEKEKISVNGVQR